MKIYCRNARQIISAIEVYKQEIPSLFHLGLDSITEVLLYASQKTIALPKDILQLQNGVTFVCAFEKFLCFLRAASLTFLVDNTHTHCQ